MAMKILIPWNFGPNDEKSIRFAVNHYRENPDAQITLFHVFSPVPEIDTRNNPIMEKLNRETLYLRHRQHEEKEAMEEARRDLIQSGFKGDQVDILFKPVRHDVAEDIIRLVRKGEYNRVILNRNPGNIVNYFSRSISKRVIRKLEKQTQIHIVN